MISAEEQMQNELKYMLALSLIRKQEKCRNSGMCRDSACIKENDR